MLRNLHLPKQRTNLQDLSEYRDQEAGNRVLSSVSDSGVLLEYETLELRVHPANVEIDNSLFEDRTLISLDSANRPGTLVELVQCLTELGLNVCKARISSDGGWFIDQFEVMDNGGKVINEHKLRVIQHVLSPQQQSALQASVPDTACDNDKFPSTIVELAGTDRVGLLCDIMSLLQANECTVQAAAVWTCKTRVAFVIAVIERHQAVDSRVKLERLQQILGGMMGEASSSMALVSPNRGPVHFERRLHQLLLQEDVAAWKQLSLYRTVDSLQEGEQVCSSSLALAASPGSASSSDSGTPSNSSCTSSGASDAASTSSLSSSPVPTVSRPVPQTPASRFPVSALTGSRAPLPASQPAALPPAASRPEVIVSNYKHKNYWLVTIRCRDRTKLFFDTVCTLADLQYDVYHASVDVDAQVACQIFYVRPRYGDATWRFAPAAKLAYCLERAILRRFPKGLKLHITTSAGCGYDVSELITAFRQCSFLITRANVRPLQSDQTFYLLDGNTGALPVLKMVQQACQAVGGKLLSGGAADGGVVSRTTSGHPGVQPAAAHGKLNYNVAGGGSAAAGLNGAKFGFQFVTRPSGGDLDLR